MLLFIRIKYVVMLLLLLLELLLLFNPNGSIVFGCHTPVDCGMNGECIINEMEPLEPGYCKCLSNWKGITCEVLNVQSINKTSLGLQLPNNVSTWGGSVIYYNNIYHMYVSRIINNCGLLHWNSNSEIIRATSIKPDGPYIFQEIVVPIWAHDPNVMIVPNTNEIVLFYTSRNQTTTKIKPKNCTTTNNNWYSSKDVLEKERPIEIAEPKDSYMIWSMKPNGPWSKPVKVLDSTVWNSDYWKKFNRIARCDNNLNGIILRNQSFIGLWRKCETDQLKPIPHTIYASNWKDPTTYKPNLYPLFVLDGSGVEDPSNIWITTINHTTYHTTTTKTTIPKTNYNYNNNNNNHTNNTYYNNNKMKNHRSSITSTTNNSNNNNNNSITTTTTSNSSSTTTTTTSTTRILSAYHVIFHDEQTTRCMLPTGCSPIGKHAFSLDGISWKYSTVDAYTRHINFTDGTSTIAYQRERPHVIIDSKNSFNNNTNNNLLALTNGFTPNSKTDYVYTLVQPLVQEEEDEEQQQQKSGTIDNFLMNKEDKKQ